MGLGERAIEACDWSKYGVCPGGLGSSLPSAIAAFIGSNDAKEASELWMGIENLAFAQNTIYPAADPLVEVLMAALVDDRPREVRQWIIDMLRFLLTGANPDDPDLVSRCQERGRAGLWLLAREARDETGSGRADVLNIVSIIDPDRATQWKVWLERP